jgi:hypothetical protein
VTPGGTSSTGNRALRAALVEALHENRGLLREVVAEVLEDIALTEAIREGRKSAYATRKEVARALRRIS